jgi:beta-fructofuranosidase
MTDKPALVTAGRFRKIYDPSIGESEAWYINDHTLIQDASGLWHMIGITHPEPAAPFDERVFAHATATDLWGPWTKQPQVLAYDPAQGETQVWAPHAFRHDERYWIFYCGGGTPTRYRIQLATSDDLWSFARHADNPMLIDGYEARDPMVLRVGEQWVMYYTATSAPEGGHHTVEAVESDDLVHWSNKQQVFRSSTVGTGGGPTESPFVVARGGKYYLFVCTNTPYLDTAVYVSDSPFMWEEANRVGQIRAHAAEVIHTSDDRWFITSAGWGTGGLYMAELHWHD